MQTTPRIGTPLSPSATRVMLLGAGELGKEVIIALQRLGVEVIAVDRYENAPGHQVAHRAHVIDMTDPVALRALIDADLIGLIRKCDIVLLSAIALRERISARVAETLIARQERAVTLKLVARPDVPVPPALLSLLASEQGVDDAEMRGALNDHGVIFFHDQKLTPEQHIAFAARFGEIDVNRFFKATEGYPQIAEVRKEPNQKTNIGGGWHTDHSYDQIPALGSILLARNTPTRGGDTGFACMNLAYEALSDGLKKTLGNLRAVHSSRHVFGAASRYAKSVDDRVGNKEAATQDAEHPVVLRHPESGKKILYVNPGFTTHFVGWTPEESAPLLNYLYAHASRPEFQYRFQWHEGSIAFCDNRSTWHYALNDYQGERRLMHRITIAGCPLE